MPFPGPETALASTIEVVSEEIIVRDNGARPGACQVPSTIFQTVFQSLTRRLNDLPSGIDLLDECKRGYKSTSRMVLLGRVLLNGRFTRRHGYFRGLAFSLQQKSQSWVLINTPMKCRARRGDIAVFGPRHKEK